MQLRKIKKYLKFLSATPCHPQWILNRKKHINYLEIASEIDENVLDIGSAEQEISRYLNKEIKYVSLDYYDTAKNWYGCIPNIYGDAKSLPINDESFSTILILDVLEHLPYPEKSISEICRVLKPGGKLIIQTPFLYPLHDQPLDFNRWTEYGYEKLFERTGLSIVSISRTGKPIESACLMFNLALCKTCFESIKEKKIISILLVLMLIIVPIINIICWSFNAL